MERSFANESGNAMILALIGATVLASVVELSAGRISQLSIDTIHYRIHATSSAINSELLFYSSLGSTYRSSILPAGTNPILANCIIGDSTVPSSNPCVANVSGVPIEYPVTLYFPQVLDTTGASHTMMAGAGPSSVSATPALYDFYGNICATNPGPHCAYRVLATFTAGCGGGQDNCLRASSITLHFYIGSPSSTVIFNSLNPPVLTSFVGAAMPVSSILPALQSAASQNIVENTMPATTAAVLASLIAAGSTNDLVNTAFLTTGLSDPASIQLVALLEIGSQAGLIASLNAIAAAGVTNPLIADEMMRLGVTNSATIAALNSALSNSGVTDAGILNGFIDSAVAANSPTGGVLTAAQYTALNTAIQSTGGVYSDTVLQALAYSGFSDVGLLTSIGNGLATLPIQDSSVGGFEGVAAAGLTDPFLMGVLSQSHIQSVAEIQQMAATITAAGITNSTTALAIAWNQNNNSTWDASVSSALLAAGVNGGNSSDQAIADAIVYAGISDPTQVAALVTAMRQSGVTNMWTLALGILHGDTTPSQFQASGDATVATTTTTTTTVVATAPVTPPSVSLLGTCTGATCPTLGL